MQMKKSPQNLERLIECYVSNLSVTLISEKPDKDCLQHFVSHLLSDYATGKGVELVRVTPAQAYALEAVRQKAVELAPSFMADYNLHIDSQSRLAKFSKSAVFSLASGFILGVAANLTTAIFTDSVFARTAAGFCGLYLGIHPVASYVANRLGGQALAIKTGFEIEVKREFYRAISDS